MRASLPTLSRLATSLSATTCLLTLVACGGGAAEPLPPPPPAAPGRLVVVTQPVGAMSGAPLATQPVVQVLDLNGFPYTDGVDAITATINGGARLAGPGAFTVITVNGRATFANLSVIGPGTYTLNFSSSTLGTTSAPFTVLPAPAAQLFPVNAPTAGTSGTVLDFSRISVQDAFGGLVPDATISITASIASGPGTLSGTTTVNAIAGVANFRDLRIDGRGPFVIRYSSGALAPALSPSIRVVGPPVSVHFADDGPQIIRSGVAFVPQPTVRDADSTIILPALKTISRDLSIVSVNAGGVAEGATGGTTVVVTGPADTPTLADSMLVGVVPFTSAMLYATPGRFAIKADTTLTYKIFVGGTMTGKFIGSGQAELRFDPQQFSFVAAAPGVLPSATFDLSGAATGVIRVSFTNTNVPVGIPEVALITLKAASSVGARGSIRLSATQMLATDGTDLLPTLVRVDQALVLR